MKIVIVAASILFFACRPAVADVNSLFLNGLTFFDTGDLDQTAEDIHTADLSPGFDGDFLLSFRDKKRTSVLAGFGILWSRRTEKKDDLSWEGANDRARLEALGFPFTVGFARKDPERNRGGWTWGAFAHYYFVKFTVDADPGRGDPSGFRLDEAGRAEREGEGPAVSVFAIYDLPFFLGRAGVGVKGRWASVSISDESGLSTPELDLSGATVFLSIAMQ